MGPGVIRVNRDCGFQVLSRSFPLKPVVLCEVRFSADKISVCGVGIETQGFIRQDGRPFAIRRYVPFVQPNLAFVNTAHHCVGSGVARVHSCCSLQQADGLVKLPGFLSVAIAG